MPSIYSINGELPTSAEVSGAGRDWKILKSSLGCQLVHFRMEEASNWDQTNGGTACHELRQSIAP